MQLLPPALCSFVCVIVGFGSTTKITSSEARLVGQEFREGTATNYQPDSASERHLRKN